MTKKTIIIQLDDTNWDDKTLRIIFETALDNKGTYAIAIINHSTILETAKHYSRIMLAYHILDREDLFRVLKHIEYDDVRLRELINMLADEDLYEIDEGDKVR